MKRTALFLIISLLSLSLFGCSAKVNLGDADRLNYVSTAEDIMSRTADIVIGEVISRGGTQEYDVTTRGDCVDLVPFAYTPIKIKVTEQLLGEKKEEIIYKETGGSVKGKEYTAENLTKLKEGDKVLLCLTKGGTPVSGDGEGIFIIDGEGYIEVSETMLSDDSNAIQTGKKIRIPLSEYKEHLNKVIEKTADKYKGTVIVSENSDASACYFAGEIYIDSYITESDLIVSGTVKAFGDSVKTYGSEITYTSTYLDKEVIISIEGIYYGEERLSDDEKDELIFLTDESLTYDTVENQGKNLLPGDKVVLFLREYGGELYLPRLIIKENGRGGIIASDNLIPYSYRDMFERPYSSDEYGQMIKMYIEDMK